MGSSARCTCHKKSCTVKHSDRHRVQPKMYSPQSQSLRQPNDTLAYTVKHSDGHGV